MILSAHLDEESALFQRGFSYIAGMDEVGRGSLAGPVCVGVAAIDADTRESIEGLIDSKALSEKKRLALVPQIESWCLNAIGSASPAEIDALGMTLSLRLAGQRALAQIAVQGVNPDALLLDGKHDWLSAPDPDLLGALDEASALYERLVTEAWAEVGKLPWTGPVTMIVKGDFTSATIAAASIVAKVYRDQLMTELDAQYPGYGWAKNKGYGAKAHREKIAADGPTPLHRLSWNLPITSEQANAALTARIMENYGT